jgi:hypothetical protein
MSVLTSLIHCLNLELPVPTCNLHKQFMFALTTNKMSFMIQVAKNLEGLWIVAHNCMFGGPEVTQKPTPSKNPKLQYLVNISHHLHNKPHEVVVEMLVQVVEKEMLPTYYHLFLF